MVQTREVKSKMWLQVDNHLYVHYKLQNKTL